MSKFKVGDRVGTKSSSHYDHPSYGTVTAVNEKGDLKVKSDNENYADKSWNSAKYYLPEEEAKKKFSNLEEKYNEMASIAGPKLEESARLLKEAVDFAASKGYDFLDIEELMKPMYNTMKDFGWNTSSLNC